MSSESLTEDPSFEPELFDIYTPQERGHPLYEKAVEVIHHIGSLNILKSTKEAAALSLYNSIVRPSELPEQERYRLWVHDMDRLEAEERWAQNPDNILPTVGFELEVPKIIVGGEESDIISCLGIDNIPEPSFVSYHEFRTHYSYSARTQAFVLQELYKFKGPDQLRADESAVEKSYSGVAADDLLDSGLEFVSEGGNFSSSLHMNFGVPAWVQEAVSEEENGNLKRVILLLTLSFVSPNRLQTRKTLPFFRLKAKGTAISSKNHAKPDYEQKQCNTRIELRTGEFLDESTYKMLIETQYLMAGYFCRLSSDRADIGRSVVASMWDELAAECNAFLSKEGINYADAIVFPQDLADALRANPNVATEARSIIDRHAMLIKAEIEKQHPR